MKTSNYSTLLSKLGGIFTALLIFSFCLTGIPGCGGGSSGTGFKRYEGTVSTESGRAAAGVLVTIVGVNGEVAQTYTNSEGQFVLEVDTGGESNVTVQFEGTGISTTAVLSDVPTDEKGDVTVKASFLISNDGTAAVGTVTGIEVTNTDGSVTSSTGSSTNSLPSSSSSAASSSSIASSSSSSHSSGGGSGGSSGGGGGGGSSSTPSSSSSSNPPSSSSSSSSSSQPGGGTPGGGGGGGGPTCPPTCTAG